MRGSRQGDGEMPPIEDSIEGSNEIVYEVVAHAATALQYSVVRVFESRDECHHMPRIIVRITISPVMSLPTAKRACQVAFISATNERDGTGGRCQYGSQVHGIRRHNGCRRYGSAPQRGKQQASVAMRIQCRHIAGMFMPTQEETRTFVLYSEKETRSKQIREMLMPTTAKRPCLSTRRVYS